MRLPAHPARIAGQLMLMTTVMAGAALISDWPSYSQIPADSAVIKLSFTHGASRATACRQRTQEELQKLAPNMRRPTECPRGRPAVDTELLIDGQIVFGAALPPSGLSRDGPSQVYRRFTLQAGEHDVTARLRDRPAEAGFTHEHSEKVTLRPGQSVSIDFRPEQGGFVFR